MKIAVLGGTGWIGSHIVAEARARGLEVVVLTRRPDQGPADSVETRQLDITDPDANLNDALRGCDALIAAIGGRAEGNHAVVPQAAAILLNTSIPRLLWVGGAGSLEVAPGVPLITTPDFPDAFKDEALVQGEALEVFRASSSAVNWTFICPAADIFPGEPLGHYRIGGDTLLTDEQGQCRISVTDYAAAVLDELAEGTHSQQRIGVAY